MDHALIFRKKTKEIVVGNIKIGADNPIAIQSMTKVYTKNFGALEKQINDLCNEGCEIIRVAVNNKNSAEAIGKIKKKIKIPIVADIHFDYKLAISSIEYGADKIRINPGNIGPKERIKKIIEKAKLHNTAIRIGVNSGSLEKEILLKHGKISPDSLVESALEYIKMFESFNFFNFCISIKSSSVPNCIEAYKNLSSKTVYPLHVGITESGTTYSGTIKSSVGIGAILSLGIGDTIRVSLTGDPVEEVRCAKEILKSLGLRKFGIEIISCPTCGRTMADVVNIAKIVEEKCKNIKKNIKVAIMGCNVNGPGEAREADIGIACVGRTANLFKKGIIIRRISEENMICEFIKEIENF